MATYTDQQILDAVREAIHAKLVGGAIQSYSIGGRNIQHMSLESLQKLEKDFQNRIAASSGSGRTYAKFVDVNE
jgi:hypothetical protein